MSKVPVKICILTSVHPLYDTRIFYRETKSLVKAGYDVVLLVQHDKKEIIDGIRIVPLSRPKNRFERMAKIIWKIFLLALREKATIYHFHDPELIPVGLLLKILRRKVIYDIHEDYVTSIRQKEYLPIFIKNILAVVIGRIETMSGNFFTLILAEKYYSERFPLGTKILNYPLLQQSISTDTNIRKNNHKLRLIYTGTISIDRGALIYAGILSMLANIEIWLIGHCPEKLAGQLYDIAGINSDRLRIEGVGYHVPHQRISDYYISHEWTAGLAIFPPTEHYIKKELTKFFEYMAAGIPIISSDFTMWKKIVEGEKCGICIDALDPEEINRSIRWIIEHPEEARKMGENGRRAVVERYNWGMEEKKLLRLYKDVLS